MSLNFDEVAIIVRECGERTAEACVDLLRQLAPGQAIHRVSARPFSAALRESLLLGSRLARPWTLCIDADVLVLPALIEFVADARDLHPDVFAVQALVRDKLLPSWRPAGNHLYRTEMLPLALPLIPRDESLRPETAMIQAMGVKGFWLHQSRRRIGLHDFEQQPADIYAKAYLHAHKHAHLAHVVLPLWQSLSASDSDYATALQAYADAEQEGAVPRVCRDFTDAAIRRSSIQFMAKSPLSALTVTEVVDMVTNSEATPADAVMAYRELQEAIDDAVFPPPPPKYKDRHAFFAGVRLRLRLWRWLLPILLVIRRNRT